MLLVLVFSAPSVPNLQSLRIELWLRKLHKHTHAHIANTRPIPVSPVVLDPVGSALRLDLDTAHYRAQQPHEG